MSLGGPSLQAGIGWRIGWPVGDPPPCAQETPLLRRFLGAAMRRAEVEVFHNAESRFGPQKLRAAQHHRCLS